MPPVLVPGPGVPGETRFPISLLSKTTVAAGVTLFDRLNAFSGMYVIVTHIDMTVIEPGSAGPLFASFSMKGGGRVSTFYYDSQSIGEGGGVLFAWRGAVVQRQSDTLELSLDSGSVTVSTSVNALGWLIPQPPFS